MAERKDCFGYKVKGYCGTLTEMVCQTRECSFYKTKKQFAEDAKEAKKRIGRTRGNA